MARVQSRRRRHLCVGSVAVSPLTYTMITQNFNSPFAASHSGGTEPPYWRARAALGQDKERAQFIQKIVISFVCLDPEHLLLSSMAVLYHVIDYLQRTLQVDLARAKRSKGWRSNESARLPPMWPGFKSRRRRHMWVEFVVGSLLYSERFFSGYSGFPLSSKTSISKFKFDQESGRRRTTLWMCYLLQIIIYLINLFI